ncbi:glycosyltransferase [Aquisalinus flavus]|uniref:Glycosyltransferase n=1 Tax=Aquisalinus flavus TaxID=1526572 RepID=A0A8J2Y3T8_9PROT|nr:glycosyltransferase [Aquisalinus flavus]MBD0426226.1 glycosyltransferase [Aquisalinus flavus]UNE48202.1 glycosyltransferase [Aquisalinus flavus]GGD09600.1 hypothetical protein GCM10011342_18110 [Aquisalinus flavus]
MSSHSSGQSLLIERVAGAGMIVTGPVKAAEFSQVSVRFDNGDDLAVTGVQRLGEGRFALTVDWPEDGSGAVQLWRAGEMLASRDLALGTVQGQLLQVGAGKAHGWLARPGSDAPVTASLFMNGEEVASGTPNVHLPDHSPVSTRGGLDGFAFDLPADAFDGQRHRFWIEVDGRRLGAEISWAHDYVLRMEKISAETVTGWCYDPAAPDLPLDLALYAGDRKLLMATTQPRPDVLSAKGAKYSGFSFVLPQPVERFRIGPAQTGPDSPSYEEYIPFSQGRLVQLVHESIRAMRTQSGDRQTDLLLKNLQAGLGAARATQDVSSARVLTLAEQPVEAETCIAVPVYMGYDQVVRCLESIVANTREPYHLVIVNDASPDPEITRYLREFSNRHLAHVIELKQNRGFPEAVNQAFAIAGRRDVVVLNADTAVPEGWLGRLRKAAYSRPDIASVSPMSNNATILSYPRMNIENAMAGMTLAEIDGMFRDLPDADTVIDLPTAHGFCMYIKGNALAEVGPFGTEWGRGYAEEVDWSIRAKDRGFTHVVLPGLFVEHEGRVSFGKEEGKELSRENGKKLAKKFPEYRWTVQEFIQRDPLRRARNAVTRQRLLADDKPLFIHMALRFTGGIGHYLESLEEEIEAEGGMSLRLTPREISSPYDPATDCDLVLEDAEGRFCLYLTQQEALDLLEELATDRPSVLHLHGTIGFKLAFAKDVVSVFRRNKRHCVSTVHDYSWFCPRVQMLLPSVEFCGQPPVSECENCIAKKALEFAIDQDVLRLGGVQSYIDQHADILAMMNTIMAPSMAAADYMQERFPSIRVEHAPHPEQRTQVELKPVPRGAEQIHIAIVGAIGYQKGFHLVEDFLRAIRRDSLPIKVTIFGYSRDDKALKAINPDIETTGRYEQSYIEGLIRSRNVDLMLFPSLWPETYSYTISEAWRAGINVIALDMGAQAERIRLIGGGAVVPPNLPWRRLGDWILEKVRNGAFDEKKSFTFPEAPADYARLYGPVTAKARSEEPVS